MKKLLFLVSSIIAIVLLQITTANSQNFTADTTLANKLLAKSKNQIKDKKFDSARWVASNTSALYQKHSLWK